MKNVLREKSISMLIVHCSSPSHHLPDMITCRWNIYKDCIGTVLIVVNIFMWKMLETQGVLYQRLAKVI